MIFNRNNNIPGQSGLGQNIGQNIQNDINKVTGVGIGQQLQQRSNQLLTDAANAIANAKPQPTDGNANDPNAGNVDQQKVYQQLLNDAMGNLNNVENKSTQGRDALSGQLKSDAARALLEQRAKAGAAGMGLSGAAQALDAGTQSVQGRQQAMALDQYDMNQQQQIQNAIQGVTNAASATRQNTMNNAALASLEVQLDQDLDNDGMVGGASGHKVGQGGWGDGIPGNNDQKPAGPTPSASSTLTQQKARSEAQQLTNNQGDGTQNNPFGGVVGVTSDQAPNVIMKLVQDGFMFTKSHIDGGAIIVGDQFGNYFKFDSGLGPMGMGGDEQAIINWFDKNSGEQV